MHGTIWFYLFSTLVEMYKIICLITKFLNLCDHCDEQIVNLMPLLTCSLFFHNSDPIQRDSQSIENNKSFFVTNVTKNDP